ncbi:MAG TPA: hypothetical protein VFZ32_12335 [Micromonosporaceae bacterium]
MADRDPSSDTGHHVRLDPAEQGGASVCWLPRVCPECGRLADTEPPTRCPRCGAEIDVNLDGSR